MGIFIQWHSPFGEPDVGPSQRGAAHSWPQTFAYGVVEEGNLVLCETEPEGPCRGWRPGWLSGVEYNWEQFMVQPVGEGGGQVDLGMLI
jgi:hypothetical protein